MLGSLIIYLKGMRRMMFQLSGFYYRFRVSGCGPEGIGASRFSGNLGAGSLGHRTLFWATLRL